MNTYFICVLLGCVGISGIGQAARVEVGGWSFGWRGVLIHSAVNVFGKWYEYGVSQDCGYLGCSSDSAIEDPRFGKTVSYFGISHEYLFCDGETTKTESQFNNWIATEATRTYRTDNYRLFWHNCHSFSGAAARFLGLSCTWRDFIASPFS